LEDLSVDGKIMLEQIFGKNGGKLIGCIWLMIGPFTGCFFERGSVPSGSIKGGEFLDYLSDY
jgi:hypothetical protein